MKSAPAILQRVALAIILGACSGAPARETAQPSVAPDALAIGAKDLAFSTDALSAPAGQPFQIVFDNREAAPHNVAIYRDASLSEKILAEEPFGGPRMVVYQVPALAPGTFFFRCDLHPDMQGTLTVAPPQGWTTVTTETGDLRMALPPWLVLFGTGGAIFANEQPKPGGFLQLMAQGPRDAIPQPVAGESLERWLESRIEPAGPGERSARAIDLPSGFGVVMEIVVDAHTPHAWRVEAYAIRTPSGVAYLLIDGPPATWLGHESDVVLIPKLLSIH